MIHKNHCYQSLNVIKILLQLDYVKLLLLIINYVLGLIELTNVKV